MLYTVLASTRSISLCPKLHVFCHFAHELLSPPAEICMLKTPRPDYLAKTENTEKKETKKDEEHLEEADGFFAGAGADSTAAACIRAC